MAYRVPFNRPFIAGKELFHIAQAVTNGQIAADGPFTERCSRFMEERFEIQRVLMTPSCTAALEMAASLAELGPGDEVILPSYTFVSTANAVARLGAKPVFVDIRPDTMNIDETRIEAAIGERTKMIMVVHYAGVGCEMDVICELAEARNLCLVEDAAQGVNAYYKGRALGSIGHLGTYSFHETKNYICGEGGALCINDPDLTQRAEIIRDKGTNRQRFLRGQVDKYTWVDVGSSHVPSEISSAFLWGQFENLEVITARRQSIYERYLAGLGDLEEAELLRLPRIPKECRQNYHMFYVLLPDQARRDHLMRALAEDEILAVFHYVPLHTSPMGESFGYKEGDLPVTEDQSARILRLPFYFDLSQEDQNFVIERIHEHVRGSR